ncbi:MAG: zincin-like metallopeptidase domain-containing protein, partial [Elioraea tepidiphila]
PQTAFHEPVNYYRTCFHELGHWAGHPSRLARDLSGRFGSRAYAAEELVAEMASAFVCAALGIVPTVRHADYIASWLDLLRDAWRLLAQRHPEARLLVAEWIDHHVVRGSTAATPGCACD